MRKKDPKISKIFINRELSWLEFNQRVLEQGQAKELPLLERMKFLSIVSSNLDEFFMVRVAGLMQQSSAGLRKRDPAGLTANEQLELISKRVGRMLAEQAMAVNEILEELAKNNLCILRRKDWSDSQAEYLSDYFSTELMPVLTPLAIEELNPPPLLPGRQLNVALAIAERAAGKKVKKIIIIPVPGIFRRFIEIPSQNSTALVPIEDIIAAYAYRIIRDKEVISSAFFRILRDADLTIQEEEASDLISMIEQVVFERRRRAAVRLTVSGGGDSYIKNWLIDWLELDHRFAYLSDTLLDSAALMEIVNRKDFDKLKITDWPPQKPSDLLYSEDIWQTVQDHDVLLSHPYESFEPIIDLLEQAAEDPAVLAIKQTLYRTSKDSAIVKSLEKAAANGKEVTVLVELKARFDESRNVNWARRLEDAGCHVIYGVVGLKTHAKALLLIRREDSLIRRYAHLSTGNYNEFTSKIYSDVALMTCDSDITKDVSTFFNLLTGSSETYDFSKLTIAPIGLRKKIVELIERERLVSTPDRPGLIMAKLNSLEDKEICQALARAGSSGVKIRLNVRGICCLRPGIKGLSSNIEVVSIVDRYLEHSRIFYFNNAGHSEVYISSADWMRRNIDKRLEILIPILSAKHKERLTEIMRICFEDNSNCWILQADGSYKRKKTSHKRVRAQETFWNYALAAVRKASRPNLRFKPITEEKQA